MKYAIEVETTFSAAHAIAVGGIRESVHGHNWRVVVTIAGTELDGDGLLCDFHTVESQLRDVVAAYHNRNLNEVPPFDKVNPTAELVAEHIGEEMRERLGTALAPQARVAKVSVSEAVGCVAVYVP